MKDKDFDDPEKTHQTTTTVKIWDGLLAEINYLANRRAWKRSTWIREALLKQANFELSKLDEGK